MDNLPLGNFDSNCNQIAQQVVMQPTQVDFNVFNSGRFFEIIKNIDTLTEEQIEGVIDTYLDVIVEKTLSDDSRMGTILCNPKFVNAYCRVMRRTSIDFERRLFCNKLTYEYGIVDGHNEVILNKFREISAYVNHHQIIKLAGRGIPKKIAEDLVTCRFSSRHENVNVQRLNFSMCKYNCEIFTEQRIIWIYEDLFDRISDLFIYSMLEVYSERELDDFGTDFGDIYGNISLAILVILNNMPSVSIRQVILKYLDAYEEWFKKRQTKPRFSLRALSYDYERVVNIVDKMIEEGFEIP